MINVNYTLEAPQTVEPRIYVASLSDYNSGRLYGKWITITSTEEIMDAIKTLLAGSPEPFAEEWAIHDYEGFGKLVLSEYESIDLLVEVVEEAKEHGEIFYGLLNHLGGLSDIGTARIYMEECYRGVHKSLCDYVNELIEDCYGTLLSTLPDFIRYHIDMNGIAHDMELNGELFSLEADNELHIFDGPI